MNTDSGTSVRRASELWPGHWIAMAYPVYMALHTTSVANLADRASSRGMLITRATCQALAVYEFSGVFDNQKHCLRSERDSRSSYARLVHRSSCTRFLVSCSLVIPDQSTELLQQPNEREMLSICAVQECDERP